MEIDSIVQRLSDASELIANKKFKNDEEGTWQNTTKMIYDFIKSEEKDLAFTSSKNSLQNLHIDNMNSEQIWQQVELQNDALIPNYNSKLAVSDSNLCTLIAKLSSMIHEDDANSEENDSADEGVETGDDEEELEEAKLEPLDDEFSEDDLSADLDDEASGSSQRSREQEDELEEMSDLDADTFADIALEGDEPEEEEEDLDEEGNEESPPNEDEDGDEGSLSEHEGQGAMYDSFFDPPENEDSEKLGWTVNQNASGGGENKQEKESLSNFIETMEKQVSLQEEMEAKLFQSEKPWMLKGEVQKEERPENSTLEQSLEYTIAIRQKPIITEETTKNIEKLLLSRIRSQAWDDVERRIKPQADPFQYKQKLILDQEKSKKSLAAIYEEEFIRKNDESSETPGPVLLGPNEKIEELPIHKEIRKEMENLFLKLDALSNYHYSPKLKDAEIKVVSNLPSVAIEESTPTTASDATLLAPQEIVVPQKGDLKGETEKTSTDKSRQRRTKKKIQKLKSQRQEKKLRTQMKSKDGLMKSDISAKFVQKAYKKGQIKALDAEQNSAKSSLGFFNQLQNNVSTQNKKRKSMGEGESGGKKKNRSSDSMTITKLLL